MSKKYSLLCAINYDLITWAALAIQVSKRQTLMHWPLAAFALTKRKKIMVPDLETQVWLAHSRGSLLRQQTDAALMASGLLTVQIGCETDSIRSVLEIISDTDLITTMPKATTTPYLEDKLSFLDFDHPQFHRPLGTIRRSKTPRSQVENRFVDVFTNKITINS